MTSFLSRSSALQNHSQQSTSLRQLQSHQPESVSDVFSDFRSFRNEAKKKAETANNNARQTTAESPVASLFASKQQQQQQQQHQQPQRNTNGVSAQSPSRSYLVNKGYQGQLNSPEAYQSGSSVRGNSFSSNLDSLKRDIREISLEKNSIRSSRPRPSLQESSTTRRLGDSPNGSASSKFKSGLQFDNRSSMISLRPKESQSTTNANGQVSQTKLISYSPEKHSQKVFSPNRLLSRLSSQPHTIFADLEFSSKPSTSGASREAIATPTSSSLSSRPLNRSSSQVSSNLQQLLIGDKKAQIQPSSTPFSKHKLNVSTNSNSSTFLGSSQINTSGPIFNTPSSSLTPSSLSSPSSQASYLIDRKTQDLSDYLSTISPSAFNTLPRHNIENLIKLSSVIMSRVKSSTYYKASLF